MDALLHALADPCRRTVLERLRDRPATVNELASHLPIARPGVSRHLRVLRETGLVVARKDAQRRIYSLRREPIEELDRYLRSYLNAWSGRMSALHREVSRGRRRRRTK